MRLPEPRSHFLYWIITGIFIFLFFYLLVKLFPFYDAVLKLIWQVLSPFVIAALIAYLLYPIIAYIHRFRIPKWLAILFIYILFFGGGAYLLYRIYPMIVIQLRELEEQLPQLTTMYEAMLLQLYESTSFLPETFHDKLDQLILGMESSMENMLVRVIGRITKIVDIIILLTVIPVLVFYFLKDFTQMKLFFKRFIPKKYLARCSLALHAADEKLGSYIRGQLLISLIVTGASYLVFYILHLNYALLLAIILGITNIIPYFGPIIGAVPAVVLTLAVSTKLAIIVLIAIFIIQLLESNFLAPYIVGKSIDIHPVAIIFVLLLGGKLGGVIGMIGAVPILTIMKVIVEQMYHHPDVDVH